MKRNETSLDDIYRKLKEEIDGFQNRYIHLKRLLSAVEGIGFDMPAYLQSPKGQAVFYNAIMKLVSEQLISPVAGKPDTPQGLHLKYRFGIIFHT